RRAHPPRQLPAPLRPRPAALTGASVDVFDAIEGLRATRVYEDRPLPPDVLTRILEAGTRACSSGNTQPWELVVVVDRDRKQHLADGFATIDEQRAQSAEQLVDGSGRPVTGHAAIDHVDVVGAIVFAFWNPDRGVRMKNEYEVNRDGTLSQTRPIPGGRGS